jgi:hypothetical protein
LDTDEERIKFGREVYDQFIMKELLSQSHVSSLYESMLIVGMVDTQPSFRVFEHAAATVTAIKICLYPKDHVRSRRFCA